MYFTSNQEAKAHAEATGTSLADFSILPMDWLKIGRKPWNPAKLRISKYRYICIHAYVRTHVHTYLRTYIYIYICKPAKLNDRIRIKIRMMSRKWESWQLQNSLMQEEIGSPASEWAMKNRVSRKIWTPKILWIVIHSFDEHQGKPGVSMFTRWCPIVSQTGFQLWQGFTIDIVYGRYIQLVHAVKRSQQR